MIQLQAVVAGAVHNVGRNLRRHYGRVASLHNKSDLAYDTVTALDLEVEKYLADCFARYDSTIGFMGEERGHTGSQERYWLVDPIDGTEHFIRGMPFCTTMVALVEHGQVVLSVIYNFVTDEFFWAERGKGATCNGVELRVSDRPLRGSYLSVETNLRSSRSVDAYTAIRHRCAVVHTISCGYEFGLIAQGKLDGRICFDPFGKVWDYGPGSLLIAEAGGRVTNIGSDRYDLHNLDLIASNPQIHTELSRRGSPLTHYME